MDFKSFAAQPDEKLDLLLGSLLIARDAYPGLDLAEQASRLDLLVEPLLSRKLSERPVSAQSAELAEYLYGTCGFRGNEVDYYDPRNSFLNDVLDRRLGIPISLAIVYVEVARRAGVRARGVGFPGRFLVRLEDPERGEAQMIDPFASGAVLDRQALQQLLKTAKGSRIEFDSSMLAPAPTRHVLARVLMNLRAIYANRGDYPHLLLVLDRLIDLMPEVANEVRDRGLLWAKLGAPAAAVDDLKRYIDSLPHAGDVAEVRRLIDQLERSSSRTLN